MVTNQKKTEEYREFRIFVQTCKILFLLINLAEIMYSEAKKVSSSVKKVSEKNIQNNKTIIN